MDSANQTPTSTTLSRIGFGLSGLPSWTPGPVTEDDIKVAERLMHAAIDAGVSLLDTASPYALGRSEAVMGAVFSRSPGLRARCTVQTKCGQILCEDDGRPAPPRLDLSRKEILHSTERSLKRLQIEKIDILLLHQPTPLMEPEEIAAAFDALHQSGKVRAFGVSNFAAGQIRLLQRALRQKITVNQLHISLYHPDHILAGMAATLGILEHLDGFHKRLTGAASVPVTRTWSPASESFLDYARLEGIQVQAWSPLRHRSPGAHQADADFTKLEALLQAMANALGVSSQTIALAWLMRHPAGITPIMSTSSVTHLAENARCLNLTLSETDWYALLRESVLATCA